MGSVRLEILDFFLQLLIGLTQILQKGGSVIRNEEPAWFPIASPVC